MFPELRFTEAEIRKMIDSATPEAVANSLAKEKRNYFDLLNLISPAAMRFLPQMREASQKCRRRYYGKTVTIYAPLYISNSCVNGCKYCDFNIRHKYERKSLTLDEIRQEADAILAMGIDSLLIVAGEDPVRMSVDFLCEVGRMLKEKFSYLSLEIAPQEEEGYRRLFEAGYEGLTLFQETYNQELYRELHPVGPKRVYDFRVWSQLRAGRAGMRNLGMAFLLGLDEWRLEAGQSGRPCDLPAETLLREQSAVRVSAHHRDGRRIPAGAPGERRGPRAHDACVPDRVSRVRHDHFHARMSRFPRPHGTALRRQHERRFAGYAGRLCASRRRRCRPVHAERFAQRRGG